MPERNPAFRQGGVNNSLSARLDHVNSMLKNIAAPSSVATEAMDRLHNEQLDLLDAIDQFGANFPFTEYVTQRNGSH